MFTLTQLYRFILIFVSGMPTPNGHPWLCLPSSLEESEEKAIPCHGQKGHFATYEISQLLLFIS